MLLVTAIDGRSEPIATARDFRRNRRVNAEKEISFSLLSDETNQIGFELVQSLSAIRFQNETYVIDEFEEYGEGDRTIKNIGAVHEFFPKMIDIYEYDITSGTKTFGQILGFIFNDTPYVYSIIDSFDSKSFENFGDDNKLALFQKALNEYGAEFELIGNTVRLKKEIGNHTDFQFRYNFNIKTFSREEDVKGLTTYVKGFGQPMVDGSGNPSGSYVVQGEYSSPNIAIFGKREAKPVRDERITNLTTLTNAMKAAIQDTPLISLKLDFIDLRAAGYPYIVPNEGDYVWCIYEPMNDFTLEVRITELEESFDFHLNPVDTAVTLANMRKDVTDTLAGFNSTTKTVDKVFTSSGTVKTDVLSEDVKNATRAVNSALTELTFQNGIRAEDPTNPNQIVVFTSAGIGISEDGGATYRAALTGDGMVAEVLTSGILNTNNVKIEGNSNFYWDGDALIAQDPANIDKFVRISKNGIELTTDGGVTFKMSITADGMLAVDPSDSSKFVRVNPSGLYVAKGAMTIERPDGFKLIENGRANFDLNVQGGTPQYVDSETYGDGSPVVSIVGPYCRTASTGFKRFDYFRFKHTARYINFAFYGKGGGAGAYVYVRIIDENGNTLDTKITNATVDTSLGMTIDLGVPTGANRLLYAEFKSTSTSYPAMLRLGTKYLSD